MGVRTIYMPISNEGSDIPTTRPKTGLGSRGRGREDERDNLEIL